MSKFKSKFTKEQLKEVGNNAASGWGAVCTGWDIKKNSVLFHGNEFGETFVFELTNVEIENELKGKKYTLEELKLKIENPEEAKARGLM